MNILFFLSSIFLGVGLAMDACAVSMTNTMNEPQMKKSKMALVAGTFGVFQCLMPLIGFFVGHAMLSIIEKFIPWIALVLLGIIGGKMIFEGIKNRKDIENKTGKILKFPALLVQAIATSIDALSVGFTIANYTIAMALVCTAIVGVVTFFLSLAGLALGKKFGIKLGNEAQLVGGIILTLIGLEIFIKGII